jgi:hypothetical protein
MAPACPYAYLLKDQSVKPIDTHLSWLKAQKLLIPIAEDSSVDMPGLRSDSAPTGWFWSPTFARSLAIAAQPRVRIRIISSGASGMTAASHVTDNRAIALAQIDTENCLLSEPLPLSDFAERLIAEIGHPSDTPPIPLRTEHKTIRLLGVLAAAGLGFSDQRKSTDDAPQAMSLQQLTDVLVELFADQQLAEALIQDLLADQLLTKDDEGFWFHTQFAPWHKAISSGEQLEIHRLDLPDGQLPSSTEDSSIRLFFLGSKGQRCLVWPVSDQSHDVIIARPQYDDLRALIDTAIGYFDPLSVTQTEKDNLIQKTAFSSQHHTSTPRPRKA